MRHRQLQLQPFAKGRALRCASLAASSADGAEPVRRNVCHILEPTTPSTACTLQASPPLDAAPALTSFVSCCTLVVVGGWLPSGDRGMVEAESAAPPPAPPPVLPSSSCVRISASPRLLRIAAARIAASASLCHHWCTVGGDFLLLSPSLIFARPLYPLVPIHTNTTPHNIKPPKIIHHTKSHNSGHTHGHIAEVGDQILKGVLL